MFFTARHALSSNPLLSALYTGHISHTATCWEIRCALFSYLSPCVVCADEFTSLFHMPFCLGQRLCAVSIMKVADPASYGGVDFVHYPFKQLCCPRSFREFGHSVFDRLQGFLRWLNMGIMMAFRGQEATWSLHPQLHCYFQPCPSESLAAGNEMFVAEVKAGLGFKGQASAPLSSSPLSRRGFLVPHWPTISHCVGTRILYHTPLYSVSV
jgi:hypothetical protein